MESTQDSPAHTRTNVDSLSPGSIARESESDELLARILQEEEQLEAIRIKRDTEARKEAAKRERQRIQEKDDELIARLLQEVKKRDKSNIISSSASQQDSG